MSELWQECEGSKYITTINTIAWRFVEDQGKSSTRKLVSSSPRHDILEEMLEDTKPSLIKEFKNLHYLLFTPFRYPPLEHGSRFGRRHERNLFYAALEPKTALAEVAFYRLAFIRAYGGKYRGMTNFTSFQINVNTEQGIDLTSHPFDRHKDNISSPTSYQYSQNLGTVMREESIDAFNYYSARAPFPAKNIGIFSPSAFGINANIEKTFRAWSCFATKDEVEFSEKLSHNSVEIFNASDFFVNGQFPGLIF